MFSIAMHVRTVFGFVRQSEYEARVPEFSNQLRCFQTALRGGKARRIEEQR
jgi:hypothetical protein